MSLLRTALLLAVVAALAALSAGAASGSRHLMVGLTDHAAALNADPRFFTNVGALNAEVLRVNLYWGGPQGVARRKPANGADPDDPAYDWHRYDRVVLNAARQRVRIAFSIFATPAWANRGRGRNRPPNNLVHLEKFAYAAAARYSGTWQRREDDVRLPPVRLWIAWNEPNLNLGLVPQFRKVRGKWVIQSARDYAGICNAIYDGVHVTGFTGQRVACGVTAPRGNNAPAQRRPSVSPLAFLRAMKRYGVRTFDAYAHQPYYGAPRETPSTPPRARTAVTLGNIDVLVKEVTRLFGQKRIWLTEYGYQTRPPDLTFGVSWAQQARYLAQAYAIAREHPRIDMLLWFLVRDEDRIDGWQSGLVSANGKRKPAFEAFRRMPRLAEQFVFEFDDDGFGYSSLPLAFPGV
jgi:Glycosyl hydrolase catalytic core